jgi:hypothetical protein
MPLMRVTVEFMPAVREGTSGSNYVHRTAAGAERHHVEVHASSLHKFARPVMMPITVPPSVPGHASETVSGTPNVQNTKGNSNHVSQDMLP